MATLSPHCVWTREHLQQHQEFSLRVHVSSVPLEVSKFKSSESFTVKDRHNNSSLHSQWQSLEREEQSEGSSFQDRRKLKFVLCVLYSGLLA